MTHLYDLIRAEQISAKLAYPKLGTTLRFGVANSLIEQSTKIVNARMLSRAPAVDIQGFCLMEHDVSWKNLKEPQQIAQDVAPLQEQLKSVLNADNALSLGYIIRHEASDPNNLSYSRPPAPFVHTDWGADRIATLQTNPDPFIVTDQSLAVETIQSFIANTPHWGIYNLWLPLKTVTNRPLALCDMRSISVEDRAVAFFQNTDDDEQHSIMTLAPKLSYSWYYYPLMQSNEALCFKQYDSLEGPDAFLSVFHSAFKLLDEATINTNMRESIEFRFLVAMDNPR